LWLGGALLGAGVLFALADAGSSAAEPARGSHSSSDGQYGVRWKRIEDEALDYYLPCERIADAAGLKPADFDRIFPWSEIRLCNVRRLADGTDQVTYPSDAGFALDGSGGNVMVEIPKHYCRRYLADGYEYRLISAQPRPGFIVDPAFVEDGRQVDRVYVGAYEAHVRADGKLESVSDVYPTADKTRPEFRKHARANGTGYGLFDLRTLLMIQNLFLVEHAERNSQRSLGNGWSKILQPARTHRCVLAEKAVNRLVVAKRRPNQTAVSLLNDLFIGCAVQITSFEKPHRVYCTGRTLIRVTLDSPQPGQAMLYFDGSPIDTTTDMCLGGAAQKTGGGDSIPGHSGHGAHHGGPPFDGYRCAVKYRHMENLWGNLWCILDGVNLANGRAYFCENMDRYESGVITGAYHPTSISQLMQDDNGNVGGDREIHFLRNLGYDPRWPWLALPQDFTWQEETSVRGASDALRNGNFGDYYYLNQKATCYVHGGGFDHYWRCGLFTLRGWFTDTGKWYLYGARLILKPK
jgi:hypothetical protein